jgi:hypothetical protein
MSKVDNSLLQYLSENKDRQGNLWWVINGLTDFIVDAFVAPSLYDVDKIKEKIGATEVDPWIDSSYGFKTQNEAYMGLVKLIKLAEKKGKPCYKNGHTLDIADIKKGDFGSCKECGTIMGWVCEETSPIILCEYEDSDSMQDICLHCGEPSERK